MFEAFHKMCLDQMCRATGKRVVCVGVSSVAAQEDEGFMLEEITVTATKRSENQQKVAVAMETISSNTIKEMGKTDIDQILSTTPGGIVNVITAAPKLDKFSASATLEAGNYNLKHGEVSLNVRG